MLLGAHVSVAGGMGNAVGEAVSLRCEAMQVFTRNQRQWRPRPLDPGEARRFREQSRRLGFAGRILSHASYLINLCAPDPEILAKSREAFVDELQRCAALGIPWLCVPPGAHLGAGEESGQMMDMEKKTRKPMLQFHGKNFQPRFH